MGFYIPVSSQDYSYLCPFIKEIEAFSGLYLLINSGERGWCLFYDLHQEILLFGFYNYLIDIKLLLVPNWWCRFRKSLISNVCNHTISNFKRLAFWLCHYRANWFLILLWTIMYLLFIIKCVPLWSAVILLRLKGNKYYCKVHMVPGLFIF